MQQHLLPAKFQVILFWLIFGLSSLTVLSAEEEPICRYKVIPDESGQFILVQAEAKPQNTFPYLKDFGLLESIQWFIQDKQISVLALIKAMTGYDPNPFFQKYFYSKVENVDELLK